MTENNGQSIRTVSGFSLLELLIVIGILAVLLGMLMPATRSVRDGARRTACSNHLRHIGLAVHNYESTFSHLPAPMGDPSLTSLSSATDANRYSAFVLLAPYLEHSDVETQISNPLEHEGNLFAAYPSPTDKDYPVWQIHFELLQCPSTGIDEDGFGELSYAFCIGDAGKNIHEPKVVRGISAAGINLKSADIDDGLSNTIYMAEIVASANAQVQSQVAINQAAKYLVQPSLAKELIDPNKRYCYLESVELSSSGRGANWADGSAISAMFNTVLPPGSPNIAVGGDELCDGLYSASSNHIGGINVLYADASIHFMQDDVDCGDTDQPVYDLHNIRDVYSQSPYGVWGALGSRCDEGVIE